MACNPRTITEALLQVYYPLVLTLRDYLSLVTGQNEAQRDRLTHETDTLRYRNFLDEYTVASPNPPCGTRKLQINPSVGHFRDLVERVQISLLKQKPATKNMLTAGYRLGDVRNGGKSLVNYFVNTLLAVFEPSEWNTLYERVGADVMFHLLAQTSIFLKLPNECLCQIAGEPLINLPPPHDMLINTATLRQPLGDTKQRGLLKRKREKTEHNGRSGKRPRVADTRGSPSGTDPKAGPSKSPAQIPISRLRLFYRRPDRATGTNKITVGFPQKHVLNLLLAPLQKDAVQTRPDTRKQEANARHLSKYVFPRQYGLPSPFDGMNKGLFVSEFRDCEAQIKAKGSCKTPKRVKSALSLLEKMIWRHGTCGYTPLLQRACPSKIGTQLKDSLDETIILEMMSENSTLLYSQGKSRINLSLGSEGRTMTTRGLSQADAPVKQKPRFAEFMCTHAEVFRFVILTTRAVIPTAFWGSKRNFKVVTDQIKTFITMRRYETFSLHTVLQGFRTSDCEWLAPDTPGARAQTRVSVSDSLKRLELLQDFLFWYFDSFLIPLIRTNFYVTESSAFRNRVLYFRQDDWDTLCRPLVARLCARTFQRLSQHDAEQILRQRKLGFSFVRLLPKETGVRPIVNLRRKKSTAGGEYGQYAQSINQIMSSAFHILSYEKESQKHLLGASVFGQNEIYTKLKAFKARLQSQSSDGKLPKLYFVKVDVTACFDTIEQTKLLEILQEIISEEEYSIQRHGQVCAVAGKVKRTFVKTGIPADDQPHFLRTAHQLAQTLRHAVFVDQVLYPTIQRQAMLQLLEQHITDNIVKIGNKYYRQVIGIPQGSILSSLLCSFFYGDLERKHLKFTNDPSNVLLRLIDDYLFITTDLEQARKFLRTMHAGHPEYGCFISQDKTLTNFEDETMPNIVDLGQRAFSWCGFLIDMKDLSVTIDYSRWHDTYLQDSLTVDTSRKPGASFAQRMMQLAKSKSHIIFNDSELNSSHTVHKNIYENFLVTAMKMHYHLRYWAPDMTKSSAFLTATIRRMIRYAYATTCNKGTNRTAKTVGGTCKTQKTAVLWLGAHAFHTVLSHKSHAYQGVLRALEFDMGLPQYRRLRMGRRMKKVVDEGRRLLTLLSF